MGFFSCLWFRKVYLCSIVIHLKSIFYFLEYHKHVIVFGGLTDELLRHLSVTAINIVPQLQIEHMSCIINTFLEFYFASENFLAVGTTAVPFICSYIVQYLCESEWCQQYIMNLIMTHLTMKRCLPEFT